MKDWKTILIVVLIAMLIVMLAINSLRTVDKDNIGKAKARIEELKVVREESQLVYDILKLRYNTAIIQTAAKANPQPIVKPPENTEKRKEKL